MLPLWQIPDGHETYTTTTPIVHAEVEPKFLHDREKTVVEAESSSAGSIRVQARNNKKHMRVARANSFDPEALLPQLESDYPLKPARNPPVVTVYDYFPLLRFFRWVFKGFNRRPLPPGQKRGRKKAYSEIVESHIPLEILLVLSKYVNCSYALSLCPNL